MIITLKEEIAICPDPSSKVQEILFANVLIGELVTASEGWSKYSVTHVFWREDGDGPVAALARPYAVEVPTEMVIGFQDHPMSETYR